MKEHDVETREINWKRAIIAGVAAFLIAVASIELFPEHRMAPYGLIVLVLWFVGFQKYK